MHSFLLSVSYDAARAWMADLTNELSGLVFPDGVVCCDQACAAIDRLGIGRHELGSAMNLDGFDGHDNVHRGRSGFVKLSSWHGLRASTSSPKVMAHLH